MPHLLRSSKPRFCVDSIELSNAFFCLPQQFEPVDAQPERSNSGERSVTAAIVRLLVLRRRGVIPGYAARSVRRRASEGRHASQPSGLSGSAQKRNPPQGPFSSRRV
jgi:hypothetical protein